MEGGENCTGEEQGTGHQLAGGPRAALGCVALAGCASCLFRPFFPTLRTFSCAARPACPRPTHQILPNYYTKKIMFIATGEPNFLPFTRTGATRPTAEA